MLDPRQTRPGLNLGRYLFFNPLLRAVISTVDAIGLRLRGPLGTECNASPQRILVCLQAHIGDVIIGTSALPVLRAAFPRAEIGFLTHPGSRMVLEGHPGVDRVHTFEHWKLNRQPVGLARKLWGHWRGRRQVIRELKAARYDLAIDLYAYFPNSVLMLAACGIPTRVGWASGGFGPWLTHGLEWDEARRHVVEWHTRLLNVIVPCRPFLSLAAPNLHSPERVKAAWAEIQAREGIFGAYLVCHVGAGSARRRWVDDEWRALVEACGASGLHVVLLGHGEADERLCRQLAEAAPTVANLAGKLDWPVMSTALSGARLVIGLDSMSSHLAAAWKVPTVCITTGVTDPVWRPYGPVSHVVVTPTPCAPCYLPNGCAGMECLRQTKATTVFAQVEVLLRGTS